MLYYLKKGHLSLFKVNISGEISPRNFGQVNILCISVSFTRKVEGTVLLSFHKVSGWAAGVVRGAPASLCSEMSVLYASLRSLRRVAQLLAVVYSELSCPFEAQGRAILYLP